MRIFDINLRTVVEDDAEFILSLRTDERKKRFISETNSSLENQKEWIKKYKAREEKKTEYYFIASDLDGEDFGLYRVYKIETGLPEIGSWITKPGYQKVLNPIKLDITIKDFVFNTLQLNALQFEVRRHNLSVNKYHQMFGAELIREDEINNYYLLTREKFENNKTKLLYKFKITVL